MKDEGDDSTFIEEQGGGATPSAPEPANPMNPETLPPGEPAPPVDYAARFAAEIQYLRERLEEGELALDAAQRKTRRWFILCLLLVVIPAVALFEIDRRLAKDLADLKASAAAPVTKTAPPEHSFAFSTVSFSHWSQGDPPVRLIRRNEGICFLTKVSGHFQGTGEVVRVWIDDDGYWYLGGQSGQEGVNAECAVMKW